MNYSNAEYDQFYDCHLILPEIPEVYSIESCFGDNLNEIAYYDGPENFDTIKDEYKNKVAENIETLKNLEEQINKGIRYNESILNIIKIIEEDIIERLKTFKNFYGLGVGIGSTDDHNILRICFDVKGEGDIEDEDEGV